MRMCRQCRHAQLGTATEMCQCGIKGEVRACAPACPDYAISAYAYLESVARTTERMRSMALRAQEFREMAGRATAGMGAVRVSGTGVGSRVERGVSACVDLALQLETQAASLRARHAQVLELIEGVGTAEGRRALEMRHLERQRWATIARKLGYDVRQAQRIHRRALADVQAQMDALGIRE